MKNRKENEVAFSVFRMAIEKKYQKCVYGLKNVVMITITCSHSIFLGSQLWFCTSVCKDDSS